MYRNYVEAQVEVAAGNTTDSNRREQTEKWPRVLSHLTLNTKPLTLSPLLCLHRRPENPDSLDA